MCDWSIQYCLCTTYIGWWGLVVVHLSQFSGRPLATQARYPGFDSWQLLAFSLSSIFASQHLNCLFTGTVCHAFRTLITKLGSCKLALDILNYEIPSLHMDMCTESVNHAYLFQCWQCPPNSWNLNSCSSTLSAGASLPVSLPCS